MRSKILFLFVLILLIIFSLYRIEEISNDKSKNISLLNNIDILKLKNETYYFPAKRTSDSKTVFQPLQQFDLIFVGHDVNLSIPYFNKFQNSAALVPGRYTHVLTYIGKDKNGFAYAVEMNVDKEQTYHLNLDGPQIGGQLYFYCLGNDFGSTQCPKDNYQYGMKVYDFMWAKRLRPVLRERLLTHKNKLITTIKHDLKQAFPFQIPLDMGFGTYKKKNTTMIEDGREKGADCISYFVSLFEEIAEVCPVNIRISADDLMKYYLEDPLGKRAYLPKRYNPLYDFDINVSTIIGKMGYSIKNNSPRQTLCPEAKIVSGIPIPGKLFNSPDMVNIEPLKREHQ